MRPLIEPELYKKIVDSVPLLTVDIIVKYQDKYVLVKRKNEPLKDFYWVMGGRVYKDESLWESAMRKVYEEIGCRVSDLEMVGVYEDSYSESAFGVPTHTASIVFIAEVSGEIKLDATSEDWILSGTLPARFVSKLVTWNTIKN